MKRQIVTIVLGVTLAAGVRGAPPAEIEIVCVDEKATGYGTFQSHNQKVLANGNGIFMSHIRSRNEPYTAQQWRLSRSTDGGKTFQTIHEATHATNPAVLETDEQANLYLARPDFLDGNSYLYFFAAADEYGKPRVTPIPGSAAGKFAMAYDAARRQLYYCSQNHTFHVVGLDGKVKQSTTLMKAGKHALMQYPLLCLDNAGTLHLAWTTSLPERYLYWDIHYAKSQDGGVTWQKMDGAPLALPIIADDSGPADRISLDDEFEVHTWLSSFLVRDGKAHFLYLAQKTPAEQHYVRYDLKTARREQDITPRFKGDAIELSGLDGFFAASPSALYCVGHTPDGRVGCLASKDNGRTWIDHAVSRKIEKLYALGGFRAVTADGYVIGSFTDNLTSSTDTAGTAKVYFFRIRGGP
ncbi:MAG: BNR-4 repeat-containing protein [Verrucomicrobiales bacterium]